MALINTSKTAINTSTYTAIKLPSGFTQITGFGIIIEDGTGFYLSHNSDGTDAILCPDNFQFDRDLDTRKVYGTGDVVLCYIKGTTNTNAGLILV